MAVLPAAQGFLASAGLIVAIGAQNAFVLRQGLRREHVGVVVLLCALADALLITAGVAGLGSSLLTVAEIERQFTFLSRQTLAERRACPGLPAPRADVYPTALATYLTIARHGGFTAFRHSLYNLRYGIAQELLTRG